MDEDAIELARIKRDLVRVEVQIKLKSAELHGLIAEADGLVDRITVLGARRPDLLVA